MQAGRKSKTDEGLDNIGRPLKQLSSKTVH